MQWLLLACLFAPALGGYVIGGVDVDPPGKWPWQCSLRIDDERTEDDEFRHTCGCSLISPTWALTAAHCVDRGADVGPSDYEVWLGLHDQNEQIATADRYKVRSYVIHEDWTNSGALGFPNDIAVVRLDVDGSVDIEDGRVEVGTLAPGDAEDYAGQNCYISGWGYTTGNGPDIPNMLQEAHIDVLSRPECLEFYPALQYRESHICIFDQSSQSKGACSGDSGGPLSCQRDDDGDESQWYVCGVTSWVTAGVQGCLTRNPSMYGRVSFFYEWIARYVDDLPAKSRR